MQFRPQVLMTDVGEDGDADAAAAGRMWRAASDRWRRDELGVPLPAEPAAISYPSSYYRSDIRGGSIPLLSQVGRLQPSASLFLGGGGGWQHESPN